MTPRAWSVFSFWAAVFGIAALFYFGENQFTQYYQHCIDHPSAQEGAQYSRDHGNFIATLRLNVYCSARLINDRDRFFTAICALFVAAFTYVLWQSTENLWRVSEIQLEHIQKSDRVRSRAYMAMNGIGHTRLVAPDNQHIDSWEIIPVWQNTGQTPAINATFYSTVPYISKDAVPDGYAFEYVDKEKANPVSAGAGVPLMAGMIKIDISDIVKWSKKEVKIYLFHRVEYNDVFDPKDMHITQVCVELVYDNAIPATNLVGDAKINPAQITSTGIVGFQIYT